MQTVIASNGSDTQKYGVLIYRPDQNHTKVESVAVAF